MGNSLPLRQSSVQTLIAGPYPVSAPATVTSLLAAELVAVATVLLIAAAAVAVRDVDPGSGVVLVVVVVAVAAAPLKVVHLQFSRAHT